MTKGTLAWQSVSEISGKRKLTIELVQMYHIRIECYYMKWSEPFDQVRSSNARLNLTAKPPQDLPLYSILRVDGDDGYRVTRELAEGEKSFNGSHGSHRPNAIA